MGKVREDKNPKRGILIYCYKILRNSFDYKCSKAHIQRFVLFVICCYLVATVTVVSLVAPTSWGSSSKYFSHGAHAIYQTLNNSQVKSTPLMLIPTN